MTKSSLIGRTMCLLALVVWGSAQAGQKRTTSPVFDLNPDASLGPQHPESDYSRLARSRTSLAYHMQTSGLDAATPHTVWIVAFNYPKYCHSDPCSVADFPFVPGHDPRAQATFINAGGGLSDVDGSGRYNGRIYRAIGGINGTEIVVGPGLLNPLGADVRLVLRSHGQPDSFEELLSSIKTYRGGCNAQNGVQPVPCRDYQISIHLP